MQIQETVRDDGLRIISCFMPIPRVHVEVFCLVGSAHDPDGQRGIFHLLEHMAFKGTTTRTKAELKSFSTRNIMERNAGTGRNEVRYYGQTTSEKLRELIQYLCEIYFHSIFPETELEEEKGVVSQEIKLDFDNPLNRALQVCWKMLWKENPLRYDGAGKPAEVGRIRRENLVTLHRQWHVPKNTLVLAVGNVDHDILAHEVEKWAPLNYTEVCQKTWDDEYHLLPVRPRRIVSLQGRDVNLVLKGFKFPSPIDERTNIAVKFLTRLLFNEEGSRLWMELREKGLSYSQEGRVICEYPLGSFVEVYGAVDKKNIAQAEKIIQNILIAPIAGGGNFEDVRAALKLWVSIQLGYPEQAASTIYNKLRVGVDITSLGNYEEGLLAIIDSMTPEEVEELRARTFKPEKFATVIVQS